MTIIVMEISFIIIWLVTTFFIIRYVKKLKDDLLDRFSDTEKPPEEKSENISEEDEKNRVRSFDFIKCVDPYHLLNFIQQEHPQVIALVLIYLELDKASVVLPNLPCEIQSEVSRRIATMDRVSPEILREIERVLEKKLAMLSSEDYFATGGVESIVEVLNHVVHNSKDQIIKELENDDPELAEELKKRLITMRKPYLKIWERLKGKKKLTV